MIFFSEDFFSPSNTSGWATFCTYSWPEYKGDGAVWFPYIFLLFLFSFIIFFSRQSKQPVIIPDRGIACQISRLFSQFLFVSLTLQWGMLWCPFSGMKDVYGVTFPSMASAEHTCNFSHLFCASVTESNTGTQTGTLNTGILVFKCCLLKL